MTDNRKKKLIASVAAGIAGIGLLISGTNGNTADLPDNNTVTSDKNAVVISSAVKEKGKSSFVLKIPLFIRSAITFILWGLMTVLGKLLDKIIRIVLTPVLKFLLMWLFLSVLLLFVSVIFIKLLYPEWPLRKIITKGLVLRNVFGSLCIMIADRALKHFFSAYSEYRYVALFVMGIIVICFAVYPYIKKKTEEPLIIYNEIENEVM